MGRASQLLQRLKPRSAQGPRLLRPPLRRVHMLPSDAAHARTRWARLTQPCYKKPGAGGTVQARPEAPRLTVLRPSALQLSHVPPSLSPLTAEAILGSGGQRGADNGSKKPTGWDSSALLVMGQLPPSPLSPGNQQTQFAQQSLQRHACSIPPTRCLRTTERNVHACPQPRATPENGLELDTKRTKPGERHTGIQGPPQLTAPWRLNLPHLFNGFANGTSSSVVTRQK